LICYYLSIFPTKVILYNGSDEKEQTLARLHLFILFAVLLLNPVQKVRQFIPSFFETAIVDAVG
jgi:hypothetical protein